MCFWTEQGCIPFAFNSLYKRRRVFSSEKWYNLALIYEIGFLFYPSQYISMLGKRSKRSLSSAKGLNFLLSIIVSGTFHKFDLGNQMSCRDSGEVWKCNLKMTALLFTTWKLMQMLFSIREHNENSSSSSQRKSHLYCIILYHLPHSIWMPQHTSNRPQ